LGIWWRDINVGGIVDWDEYKRIALAWNKETGPPKFRVSDYIIHGRYAKTLAEAPEDCQVEIADGFLILRESGETIAAIPPWAWMEYNEDRPRKGSAI
jgi:hypothetical protein